MGQHFATLKGLLKIQYLCEGQIGGGGERRTYRPSRDTDCDTHIKKIPGFNIAAKQ